MSGDSETTVGPALAVTAATLFADPPDADDDRAEQTDEASRAEEEAQITAINAAVERESAKSAEAREVWRQEQDLLDRMQKVANAVRGLPEAKARYLIAWIREHLCPALPPYGQGPSGPPPCWTNRRVLVFTENVVGTKRYLREILESAISGTTLAEERIATIDGRTTGGRRREIQRRFNADPAQDPLRILLATDAAREGLNFQAHCTDLFHFDLPWNPGRIEQRNGRIDRKLQPASVVRCHYFVLPQRAEDRVLEVLVRKTETIKRELGSLSKVIDDDVERRLKRSGIRHGDAERLAREIEAVDLDRARQRVAAEELEAARERQDDLNAQIERCRGLLQKSRKWVRFETEPFRDAISCSLELLGAKPLTKMDTGNGDAVWTFPPLIGKAQADASWTATLDTLRAPRKTGSKLADWRAGGAHTAGGLRGRRSAHRRDRASALGTAHGATAPGPVPFPGVRASRPVSGLPGAGRRLHSPGDPAGSIVPVRAPGRATP